MNTKSLVACFLAILLHSLLSPIAPGVPQPGRSKRTPRVIKIIDLSEAAYPRISGDIHKGETHRYILRAKAGQNIEIRLKAETRPTVSLYAQDGSEISAKRESYYELPRSEDYVLMVRANDDPTIASRGHGHYMIFIWARTRD
jgi:hypothetical protein